MPPVDAGGLVDRLGCRLDLAASQRVCSRGTRGCALDHGDGEPDPRLAAEARLHRDLAAAHARYAEGLERLAGAPPRQRQLGPTQLAVLRLPALHGEGGLTSREVAEALGIDQGNAHHALEGLEGLGLLALAGDGRPRRWRRVR